MNREKCHWVKSQLGDKRYDVLYIHKLENWVVGLHSLMFGKLWKVGMLSANVGCTERKLWRLQMAVKDGILNHIEGQYRWERKQQKSSIKVAFVKSFRDFKELNSCERLCCLNLLTSLLLKLSGGENKAWNWEGLIYSCHCRSTLHQRAKRFLRLTLFSLFCLLLFGRELEENVIEDI